MDWGPCTRGGPGVGEKSLGPVSERGTRCPDLPARKKIIPVCGLLVWTTRVCLAEPLRPISRRIADLPRIAFCTRTDCELGAMANAVAMAGVCGVALQGSLVTGSSLRSSSRVAVCAGRPAVVVAQAEQSEDAAAVQSRRSMLSLLAATVVGTTLVKEARAVARGVKIEPPPPLSGGLRKRHSLHFEARLDAFVSVCHQCFCTIFFLISCDLWSEFRAVILRCLKVPMRRSFRCHAP